MLLMWGMFFCGKGEGCECDGLAEAARVASALLTELSH
jgi:hypothetical protein